MAAAQALPAVHAQGVSKVFRRETGETVRALNDISFDVQGGSLTALVGPDSAGKTTILRLAAGLMKPDAGTLGVLGVDVSADPQQVQTRIAYMPQKFGLYEDLSVQENLDLYADLHSVSAAERRERYPQLFEMTALGPFTKRLAGRLSGGMKQKLGLACTLVRWPELLLLDEPTVGVDPLSRRELWQIIMQLVTTQRLTVLMSTSYLDDAERCDYVGVMHEGHLLSKGRPDEVSRLAAGHTFVIDAPDSASARALQARLLDDSRIVDAVPVGGTVRIVRAPDETPSPCPLPQGGRGISSDALSAIESIDLLKQVHVSPSPPRFEDGFMMRLWQHTGGRRSFATAALEHPATKAGTEVVVEVRDLVRRFGTFTAVDHVNFEVHRGEIFGLLGPNGAGKTTTFRMVCGLLAATGGWLRVADVDLRRARASARQRIGYVSQKFSLYGQLSVLENLQFFASIYGLRGRRRRERLAWALKQFELEGFAALPSGQLPGGYKQRLSMAAALLHGPEILFLDEPTSGADPLARRGFWRQITALAEDGVTVIVTTHFMEEAEYCDRVVIMEAGQILAQGTPGEVRRLGHTEGGRAPTIEDAFIAVVEQARREAAAKSRFASEVA